jgi:hypothetical protein
MSILEDIVEETDLTPKKSKPVVKWVVRIAVLLIGLAFAFGSFKETAIFQLKAYENQVNTNTSEIKVIRNELNVFETKVDEKVDNDTRRIDVLYERFEQHMYGDELFKNSVKKTAIKEK